MITTGNPTRSSTDLRLISQPSPEPTADLLGRSVRVLHAVGTRGDLLQVAAVALALGEAGGFDQLLVDVGPCAGPAALTELGLSGVRYIPVEIPGGGGSSQVTSRTLQSAAQILETERPEIVLTAGESDATLAWALAAAKLHTAVAMLDAGTRSWDWSDVAEINRVVCDRLADTLFTTSPEAVRNLLEEGVPDTRIHEVGATVVDTVARLADRAQLRAAWRAAGLRPGSYLLTALTQPANTEDPARTAQIAQALRDRTEPGTSVALLARSVGSTQPSPQLARELDAAGIRCLAPEGVVDELSLIAGAGAVVTDNGVLQDVATSFGVTCFVLGYAGPGPATFVHPTCIPLGDEVGALATVALGPWPPNLTAIPIWESRAARNVADALEANFVLRAAAPGAVR